MLSITLSNNPSRPTPIAVVGDPISLFTNSSTTDNMYITDSQSTALGNTDYVTIGPGGFVVILPQNDLYAWGATASVVLEVVDGGQSFFQFLKILVKTILIEATTGNGLFVYSGVPALGDLIASIVASAINDPVGNPAKPGFTTYANDGFGTFIQQNAGLEVFGNSTFPTVAAGAGVIFLSGSDNSFNFGVGGGLGPLFSLKQAQGPGNQLKVDKWHVVNSAGEPPFQNSFTAGGTTPRFQFEPINGGRVRLSGACNTGAVTAANSAIFTLPAGYRPSRALAFVTPNNVTAYTLGQASIQVIATGDVQLVPAGTAGKFVLLDGICFELD